MNGLRWRMSGLRGLLRWAMVAVVGMVFLGVCADGARAAVAVTNQFNTTPCAIGTGNMTCTNPTIGAGANRVLVLVVTGEGSGNHNPANTSATYGAATFTEVQNSYGNNDNRRYTWMGYIDESEIAANAGSNISMTVTSSVAFAGTEAYYAVYDGVDQIAPVSGSVKADSPNTTTAVSMGPITTVVDGVAIYALSTNVTGANTAVPTNYTEHVDQDDASGNYMSTIGSRLALPGTSETLTATAMNARWTGAFMALAPLSCADTNGSAITMTNPTNGATVGGSLAIAANLSNAASAEYSIDGGAWTPIDTLWNTLATHPGSSSAPVNNVTVDVRAIEDECGGYVTDSVTVTVDNTCSESTASSISFNGTTTAAGNFNGSSLVTPVDLTGLQYRITETTGGGPGAVSVLEDFSTTDITNTTTSVATANYTPPVGSNRMVVLIVQIHTNNTTATTVSMTYGDGAGGATEISATPVVNTDSAQRRQIWIATLNESQIASSSGNVVTVTTNNAGTGYILHIATYGGVDQTTPVTGTGNIYSGTTTVNNYNWGTALNVNAGGYGVVGSVASTTLTSLGANESYNQYGQTAVGSAYSGISDKAFVSAGTTLPNLVSSANAYSGVAGITLNPAAGGPLESEVLAWNADPQEAGGLLANGNTYTLYARGTDPECGTVYYVGGTTEAGTGQSFTWADCTETAILTLNPITDPITGDVTVTATGTAANIKVGTSPASTNNSGWIYVPEQDDNTTVVSFYAAGNGTCGPLSASQLNVATNTMVVPTVTAFAVPATVTDTVAPLEVPITTFTATDNVGVTGYMVTESATSPGAGDAGWSASAPTSYTVPSYNTYTLYAWAKDAAGNVSYSASATTTVQNCVEAGTVTVSISPDPGGTGTITGATTVTADLGGGASNGQVRWSTNGGADWSVWAATPAVFTPSASSFGSVIFEAQADGSCGGSTVTSTQMSRNFDGRVDALDPDYAVAIQNGLTGIQASFSYCDDRNSTGRFRVEYKLSTDGSYTLITPDAIDGGSGDSDGSRNEMVIVLLPGLTSGATYDVRMTFLDASDGLIGTTQGPFNQQVTLVSWVDNPLLHNSLRFPGTTKHGGNWGQPGNYAGGILCSTCHGKNTGNAKRVKASISFPDGSTMPGGGTSATIDLQTVEDGGSDFGDDSTAPRSSSNRVCEACHTYDAAQSVGVKQHAANQSVGAGHYDNSDCIKCHLHNAGFKADCTGCHANPPTNAGGLDTSVGTGSGTAGKHATHVGTLGYTCNTCHTGWENSGEMPQNGNINLGFNIVLGSTTDTTGTYDGRSTGGGYTPAAGTTVTAGNGLSCSALYCHGTATPAWTDAGTAACGSCHGDNNGMPSSVAGDGDLSGATSGSQVGKHPEHVINAGLACSTCHKDLGFGTPDHVSGTVDIWFDTALAGASATYNTGSNTCSNLSCHISKVWDTATPASCDMCHGYPPLTDGSANDLHVAGATPVDHAGANIGSKHNECNLCHGYSQANGATDNTGNGGDAYQVSYHRDGNIEMNGISAPNNSQSAEYDQANFGCAKACHANDAAHQLSNSGLTVVTHEYGSGSCTGCHDGSGAGATLVNDNSPHALATTGLQCEECHGSHSGGTIEIPNNPAVGINYTANGEAGIALGAVGTAPGATEAEICWNCHGSTYSEWGTNNKAATGSKAYNYGTLNQSNWVGATWTSGTAKFGYKTGPIQSTHSVNNAATVPGVDAVGDIRCSYCHDVHDLNLATSDTLSGAPYLRGTWMGNPYREDGAPQSGDSWTTDRFGAVPRGGTGYVELGGYQIDQNNGNPTTGWTLASSAGLCTLCHGTNVDTMNHFGTASTDWVGTNGHSNAVIGGTGSNAANIFSHTDRNGGTNPTYGTADGVSAGNPAMAYKQHTNTSSRGYGWRNNTGDNGDGFDINPRTTARYGYAVYSWGATISAADPIDNLYHKFSCSKCHNPHASRLPRLMITNCLDTRHNTWDDGQPTISGTNGDNVAPSAYNNGKRFSQVTSAQNCHRVGDSSVSGTGAGWNNVTPW